MIPDLAKVLSYRNDDVVHRFAETYQLSFQDAEEVFHETKRWLWICAKRKTEVENGTTEFLAVPLFNEARVIDTMWHVFLLYTEDYAQFCEDHFGFFVHHKPKPRSERLEWQARIASDPEGARREREISLKKIYESLYDELGEETLLKWCEEFPVRFKSVIGRS